MIIPPYIFGTAPFIHMKAILSIQLLLFFCTSPCKSNPIDSFSINGCTKIAVEKVYITYVNNENHLVKDSSIVTANRFSFRGSVNCYSRYPVLFRVMNAKNKKMIEYPLGIENTSIELLLDAKGLTVKGNRADKEIGHFFKTVVKQLLDSIDYYEARSSQKEVYKIRLGKMQQKFSDKLVLFAKGKMDDNSLPYILVTSREYIHDSITDLLFFQLTEKQKGSTYGRQYKRGYDRRQLVLIQPGRKVENFTTTGHSGDSVSLYDYSSKGYVLLEFWASWCNPCRAEHPRLIELYNKYRRYNLQVIGISCDEEKDKNKWLEAIKTDAVFIWPNILTTAPDEQARAGRLNLLNDYNVTAFPTVFLIDTSNKIVRRLDSLEQIEKSLKEIYGE